MNRGRPRTRSVMVSCPATGRSRRGRQVWKRQNQCQTQELTSCTTTLEGDALHVQKSSYDGEH